MNLLLILATYTALADPQATVPVQAPTPDIVVVATEAPRTSAAQPMDGPIDTHSHPLLLPDSPLPADALLIAIDAPDLATAARVHDCAGRVVEVAGDYGVVTLTGDCQHLRVRGHANVVQVQAVYLIDVIGDRNAVTWGGVPGDASGRRKPSISERGTDNVVGPGTLVLPPPASSP